MKRPRAIKELLNELFREVSAAEMHYEIYHVFTNEIDRPAFVDTMNRFIEFFAPAISAHFSTMVTSLGIIYDKDPKSIHINKLLKLMEKASIDKKTLQKLRLRIHGNEPLVKKAFVLRNNVIAHLSEVLTIQEIFKKAAITRYDFRDLINDTKDILREIAKVIGEPDYAIVASSSENGTRQMLTELRDLREFQLKYLREYSEFWMVKRAEVEMKSSEAGERKVRSGDGADAALFA